ncbi:MAG: hypothetical protein J7L34_06420, partial [Thermotogaceae bacterium]|nr:hypothetical protein [Thermotogaceae bacterium]
MICTYLLMGLTLAVAVLINPAILWLRLEKLFESPKKRKYFSLCEVMYEIVSKKIYKAFTLNIIENNSWEKMIGDIANILKDFFDADG